MPPQRLLAVGGDDRFLVALSALYLGIALGCAAEGLTLTLSHNVSAVCWVAAAVRHRGRSPAPRWRAGPVSRQGYLLTGHSGIAGEMLSSGSCSQARSFRGAAVVPGVAGFA